jgi:hypothetical protein
LAAGSVLDTECLHKSPAGIALTEKRRLDDTPNPNDATSGVMYRIEPAD